MSIKRPNVLVFVDWYLPGYLAGGPVRSIYSLCESLKHEINFYVVTSCFDLDQSEAYENTDTETWIQREECEVFYIEPAKLDASKIQELLSITKFESVYFNSLFSQTFTLRPLRIAKKEGLKVVLAPRGMLGAGALKIKVFKKQLFLLSSKILSIFKNITWHATADSEKSEIQKNFGKGAQIKTIPNLSVTYRPKNYQLEFKKEKGVLRLFFLSRIAEKKNLLFALHQLSTIKKGEIHFSIIGPVEQKESVYWDSCKSKIESLPENIKVMITGAIPNDNLWEEIRKSHFLFLPTQHENYGHVIVESWFFGCPVIISDQTPWRNLEAQKLGWDISLKNDSTWSQLLEKLLDMDEDQYVAFSKASFVEAQALKSVEKEKSLYMKLFLN